MRIASLSTICGAALLLAAGTSQAGPAKHKIEVKQARNQLICRAPVNNGLLMVRAKQCYTQAEWDARQKRMQHSIHDLQMRNLLQNN